jgi:hypothetical protein
VQYRQQDGQPTRVDALRHAAMSDGRVDYAMAVVGPASPDPWVAREKK